MKNEIIIKGETNIEGMTFTDIEGGFGEGKKAMLAKDIAKIHGREMKVINQSINMNRKRFVDNIDIIDLKNSVNLIDPLLDMCIFSKQSVSNAKNIYLLSERGYAKLLKILEDDTAWEQYDKLVDGYFNMRKEISDKKLSGTDLIALAVIEAQKVIAERDRRIEAQEKEIEYKEDIIIGLTDKIDLVDKRNLLSRLVRKSGSDYQGRWNRLYREFDEKYHINTRKRFENYNLTAKPKLKGRLDYIDKVMGKVPELYEVACRVFEGDVDKIVNEYYAVSNLKKQVASS